MFGFKGRWNDRLYWDGFRDALVHGVADPGLPMSGLPIAEEPYYRRGFDDGARAAKRVYRDALVSEVKRLSVGPGDKVLVKVNGHASAASIESVREVLKPIFPDNEVLLLADGIDLSVAAVDSATA